MDLQKTKILLDKINALFSNMSADRKNISSIEQDLMKSYILRLYESFLNMEETPERSAVEVIKSTPKVTLNKPVEVVRKEPEPAPPPPPSPSPRKPEPIPIPKPAPVPEPPKQAAPPPLPPPPVPDPPKPEPVPVRAPVAFSPSPELEDLFSFNSAKELSEKLGELPVADIKKAMGLNERIYTMNELFGGDKAVFDLTLDTLNQLPDFHQAKTFLMRNAASKYNWTEKGRVNKAKVFIKLVKRRYSI